MTLRELVKQAMDRKQVLCVRCGKPIKAFWRAVEVNNLSKQGKWLVRTGPYHEKCGRLEGRNR